MTRRIPMPAGTRLELKENTIYEIIGEPIGFGGSSIIYNAKRILSDGKQSGIVYTIKECYPVSSFSETSFIRDENGEIIPSDSSEESRTLLDISKKNILNEEKISQDIYKTAMRMIPIVEKSDVERVTLPNGTPHTINNVVTVMESLAGKGRSIHDYLSEEGHFSPAISFQIIQQVLFALKEMHTAETPYIHLDIQDTNIFLHGTLGDVSELVTLIDFGTAKPLHNGKTDELSIWTLFSTEGFTAPEILECIKNNNDHITLFPSADIYSIGCLLYLLIVGKKIEPVTIDSNPDTPLSGKELRRLKKIGFPSHLESKLQSTLSKALASKPQDRYQSVDEMLSDVRIIIESLERRRDPIEAMEYDAFICYKHGSLDTAAALRLQRNLESYRSPKGTSRKIHPFHKVFVDEGELASCPDMGEAIHTALKNSKYLIVICSPDTPSSIWVDKEIKEFTELHGRDRILAVIISGDRDSSFPDRLKGNDDAVGEIFAASAIGKNRNAVLRTLGGDALLKIASAMLGVTYDSLKQRKKTYILKNVLIISISASALLSIFFTYVLYQAHMIKEQYQKTQISQARRMADVSAELWKDGDKTGALVTALAVQSEDNPDEPVVPEQIYALNTALTSYKPGKWLSYNPAYTGAVQNISTACLSDDGKYLYVTDCNSIAYVLSGDKGELLWEIVSDKIKEAADSSNLSMLGEKFTEISHIIPYTKDEFIVTLSHCVAVLNISSKKVERVIAIKPNISKLYPPIVAGDFIVIQSNRYISSDEGIYIYKLSNGMLMDNITLSTEDNPVRCIINDIALSSDGEFLAIGTGMQIQPDSPLYSDNTKEDICGLIVYDIEKKTENILSTKVTEKVFFGEDTRLIAVFSDSPSDSEMKSGAFGWTNKSYTLAVFDRSTGKNHYMSSGKEYYGIAPKSSLLSLCYNNGAKGSVLAVWFGGELYLVDSTSASLIFQYSFNDRIASVQAIDSKRILVALEEGSVYSVSIDNNYLIYKIIKLTDINNCIYNNSSNELIVIRDGKAIFCDDIPDPTMTFVKSKDIISEDWGIYENRTIYSHINDKTYRLVMYESNEGHHASAFAIFETGTSEPVYVFKSKIEDSHIYNIGLGYKDNTMYLSFVETDGSKLNSNSTLYKVDLNSGEIVLTVDMSEYDMHFYGISDSVTYSADMTSLYAIDHINNGIMKFDISGDTAVFQKNILPENTHIIHNIYTDSQKRHLLIHISNENPYVYDTKTMKTRKIPLTDVFDQNAGELQVSMGKSSTYACFFDKKHVACIVDISNNRIVSIIQTNISDGNWNVGFFDEDKYLLIAGGNSVALYETASGKLLSKQEIYAEIMGSYIIISDQSAPYFALKDGFIGGSIQSGFQTQPIYMFYVDQKHRIHAWADIDYGYFSPFDREVLVRVPGGFSYSKIKDYQYLKTSALEALDGVTLTDEQKEKYYLTD